jgi:trigger factor
MGVRVPPPVPILKLKTLSRRGFFSFQYFLDLAFLLMLDHPIIFKFSNFQIQNMNVVLEKDSNTYGVLKISLTSADYQPSVDKQIKDFAKKANIKGFRPGKVPTQMIQRLYGKSILIEEINGMLSKTVSDYIKENKLQIVGDPIPNRERADAVNWENPSDMEFEYELGMASDFTVDFEKLPVLTSYEIQATETEVETTIADLRKRFGGQDNVEEVAAGDMVFGTFSQGEIAEKSAIPTAKLSDTGSAVLIGAKKEDTVSFDIQQLFAEAKSLELALSKSAEEVAALEGEFTFAIEDITRPALAEINQEFFDKVLGKDKVSSEEDFRKEVLGIIQQNYRREADYLLQDEMVRLLLDNTTIELPDEFLKTWVLNSQDAKSSVSMEEIEQDYHKFARDLRWSLIRTHIGEAADIKVDYPELVAHVKGMFMEQFGMHNAAGIDDQMDEILNKMAVNFLQDKKNPDQLQNAFNRVYADKVMDVVRGKINTEVKAVDLDTFKQAAEDAAKAFA